MKTVYARENEPIDILLKRFNRAVSKEGILKDHKRHEHFESNRERLRRKQAARVARERKFKKWGKA